MLPALSRGLCRRYRRIPLREFLVVPFVLQICIAVGITGGLALLNGRKAVNEVASRYRQELTTRIQQEVEDFLATPYRLTQLNLEAAQSQLLDVQDPQVLEQRFLNQIRTFDAVDFVYFGSPQGGILSVGRDADGGIQLDLSTDLAAGDYVIYDLDDRGRRSLTGELAQQDYDARQRPWFQNPVQAEAGVWTIYPYINRLTLGLTYGRPLYDPSGEVVGVFAADVLLSDLDQFLQDLELEEGQTFIVERSGEIVASSVAEPPFTRSNTGSETRLNGLHSQEPLIRATLHQLLEEQPDLARINAEAEFSFRFEGERQFAQIVPFAANDLDWLIGVVVPESSFMAQIEENTRWTIGICLAALGLATGVGIWTARRITQPLEQLSHASQSLAQRARTGSLTPAELQTTVDLNRGDEIGTLAHSYNQMALQLQEAFARLKDHNQELEHKVEERTAHLEERAQLAALDADIGIALTQENLLQETLTLCAQSIIVRLDAALVQIWTVLHRDQELKRQVSLGSVASDPDWGETLSWEAEGLPQIARHHRATLSNQIYRGCELCQQILDPAWVQGERLQAFAGFPLIVEDKVVGILVLMARHPLTEAAQQELASVSHEIALGIRRKQTESALRESEERYRGIVENASDLIVTLTPDSRCRYLSPNLPRVLGYETEELKGQPWSALIHPEDLPGVADVAERGITTGETVTTPAHRMRCKDDTWRWFVTSGSCVFDRQHTPLYLVCIARDVTDRKQAEAEMQKARDAAVTANRAKSEFLASVSHELRTPLNGILGYAQILKRDPTLSSGHRQGLDVIQRSGEHLLTLINDILDLSKIEARKMELKVNALQLPEFLTSVADLFRLRAHQKGILFLYEPITPLPQWVQGDEKRLRQVLMNLLSNAVKFTDRGGVTFQVGQITSGTHGGSPPRIRFAVRDTGRGIAEGDLEEIFLPFQQAGDQRHITEGTGLGLPISQRLVEMMGAQIQVDSHPGQGSCFWFEVELPQVEGSTSVDPETPEPIITGYRGPRRQILVIDDKWENRSVLINLLMPLGFEVIEASNGQEGVDLAVQGRPHLVLMDLVMPVMDGFEATRRLRACPELQDLVILAASASTFDQDQRSSLEAGCDGFIAKPIVAPELLETLRSHLQLEWIHAGDERLSPQIPGVETTDLEPAMPSATQLSQLWELARIGHIKGILEQLDRLEAQGGSSALIQDLRQKAKAFQVKKIQAQLRPLIEA